MTTKTTDSVGAKKLKILITNDDGIYAPGIIALTRALNEIAEIVVAAPDRNRSGASHSLSLTRPLRIQKIKSNFGVDITCEAISIDGTPTDCVHLAVGGLMDRVPDIVVSGINHGANLGDDVLYSGTVAAAMEGRFLGFPAMAISLASDKGQYYETAAIVARHLVQRSQLKRLPAATILNVNVPDLHFSEIKGYEITRLGTRHCAQPIIKSKDPRGNTIYWVGPAGLEKDAGIGTDFHAIKNNKVSITPLHVDLTSYEAFETLTVWLAELEI